MTCFVLIRRKNRILTYLWRSFLLFLVSWKMNCPFFADIKEKRKKNNFTQIMSHWSPCGHLEFESSAFAFDFNHSTAWNFKTNKRKSRWFKVIHSTLEIFFYSLETSFDHFWLTTAIWYINAQNSIELSYISILTWHSTTSEEDVFLKFLKFWILIFCRFFFVLTFVLIFWLRNCWDVKNVYTSRNLIKTSGNFLVKLQSENIKKWKITRIYIVFCSNIWGNQCESWSPQLQL